MLSRIANNLFWMARYLERAEHMMRFINVNYFSSLDAPVSISKSFVLESILRMNGGESFEGDESEILQYVTFDKENPSSIINAISFARENARAARDMISTEMWESTNKYYHFATSYDQKAYNATHLFDFAQQIASWNMIVKGRIDSTLIHNNVWDIIKIGLFTERSIQILRALITKVHDINQLDAKVGSIGVRSHQLATLLRGLESFDMSRKQYRKAPTLENSVEFLVLNPDFPRSLLFCLSRISNHLDRLSPEKKPKNNSVLYQAKKNFNNLTYTSIENLSGDLEGQLKNHLNLMYQFAKQIEEEYLT
jgi:uncharacterized alpha-E superfamily protein